MREELARLLSQFEGPTTPLRGRFTFDPVVGLRRLAEGRFRQPESYLLALVQAAVALGARQLELERHPFYTCVCWDGEICPLEPLEAGLVSLQPGSPLFWTMVGAANSRAARVLLESRSGPQALLMEPGRLERVEFLRRRPELTFSHRLLLSFPEGRSFRKSPSELALLREQCLFGPLRISCNGALIESEGNRPRGWSWKTRPQVLVEWLYPGRGLYLPAVAGRVSELRPEGAGSARVTLPLANQRCYGAWLALESDLSPGLRCRVVHEGVVVASTELPTRLGGQAVLSSDGFELDASGLRVVGRGLQTRQRELEPELDRLVERARNLGELLAWSAAGRRRLQAESTQ
ncbi:MAG: hypothetical protein KC910_09395 [Candidatus Eremiobacteraeota bacterium]|nr:hypothetical protein [Candidatus Eremiobacteraeota bacterium]